MASNTLNSLKFAILVTDGFEQVEMVEPRKALDEAGADTSIVSPKTNQVRSWNFTDWGVALPVNVWLLKTTPDDFDALLLPGGVIAVAERDVCEEAVETFGKHVLPQFDKDPVHSTTRQREAQVGA